MSLELISLRCASCGSPLEEFQGKDEKKCNACGNVTMIIRPPQVVVSPTLTVEADKSRMSNLIGIMTKSMLADNYKEAYEYANKALEIDSNSADLWLAKAVSSFWIRSDQSIIDSGAKEIITYLNSAKACNVDKPTYDTYAKGIAWNLFYATYYRYLRTHADIINKDNSRSFSAGQTKAVFDYVSLMETAFTINPNRLFLEIAIKELSGHEKIRWLGKDGSNIVLNYDAKGMRDRLINKLKSVDPSYVAPEIQVPKACFIATAAMGDYDHPVVMDLRLFRDNWLLKRNWGVRFTKWYYTHGPKAAAVIEKSFLLRKITFLLLIKPLQILTKRLR